MLSLPPVVYDYPYQPTTEWVYALSRVDKLCRETGTEARADETIYGCAFKIGDRCFMLLPKIGPGGTSRWTQNLVRRHEHGHCNGWGKSHDGAR